MTKYVAIIRLLGAKASNKLFLEASTVEDALDLMVSEAKVSSTADLEAFDLFEVRDGGLVPRAQRLEPVVGRARELVAPVVNTPIITHREHTREEEYKMYQIEDA